MRGFVVGSCPEGVRVQVPHDVDFCAGHFPNAPVVPGAALLQLALQHVAVRGQATVPRVRFVRPVRPGDELILEVTAMAAGEAGFVLREARTSAGAPAAVMTGHVRAGALPAARGRQGEPLAGLHTTGGSSELPPAASVLPHGAPAVLLVELRSCETTRLDAVSLVPSGSPYAATDWSGAALVEVAAQAAAAHGALAARAAGGAGERAPIGYLVGLKNAGLVETAPAGAPLHVGVERTGGAGPLGIYAARVYRADDVLFLAELSVWTPPTPPGT